MLGSSDKKIAEVNSILRLYQDRSGAAAYLLWPTGAIKLLAEADNTAGLADAIICRAYNLHSFQIEPACAIQVDRCQAYGLVQPIKARSAVDAGKPMERRQHTLFFRLRSIGAQLRMGLRALRHAYHSERREIQLNLGDFL